LRGHPGNLNLMIPRRAAFIRRLLAVRVTLLGRMLTLCFALGPGNLSLMLRQHDLVRPIQVRLPCLVAPVQLALNMLMDSFHGAEPSFVRVTRQAEMAAA